ncbi:MAG: rhodanese-like domain-containing protein [Candidatus Limnocylindrales bacterium]
MTKQGSNRRPHMADPRVNSTGRRDRRSSAGHSPSGVTAHLPSSPVARVALAVTAVAVILVAVLGIGLASGSFTASQRTTNAGGVTVQANGGHWTNITPGRLATMLDQKDFTLLNVKTPYIGEISGTDLYIPYDRVGARAAELPADKHAKLVVYCRSGHESAIAAQALIDLGYTNVDNLDGGMDAWTASGRQLVSLDRSGG